MKRARGCRCGSCTLRFSATSGLSLLWRQVIAVIAVIIALFFIKTTYESSTDLLVRTGRESMEVDPTSGAGEPS